MKPKPPTSDEPFIGQFVQNAEDGQDYIYDGHQWLRVAKGPTHTPHRGSDVETWLKEYRDQFEEESPPWIALDLLLDDYRLRADLGASLQVPVEELGG